MRFEWDEKKSRLNIDKHGIDFRDVPSVFELPMLVGRDEREDYGEDRWIGLGLLRRWVVVIVFTEPDEETIRIISARRATKHESKKYIQAVAN